MKYPGDRNGLESVYSERYTVRLKEIIESDLGPIELDRELQDCVMKGIDFSKETKAIADIYSRLCSVFCYDTEMFLSLGQVHRLRECSKKHQSVEYINTLSLENRQVICSDFAIVFARLVGREYPNMRFFIGEEDTGMPGDVKHSYCILSPDGYNNVRFDPLKNFTNSDFLRTKVGLPVNGIGSMQLDGDDIYEYYSDLSLNHGADISIDALRTDLMRLSLPSVEAASFVKGALRAITSNGEVQIKAAHTADGVELVSTYTLSTLDQPVLIMTLRNSILQERKLSA